MSLSDDIRRVQVKVAEIAAKEMEVVDEAIFGYIQRVADEEGVEIDVQMNRDFIVKALQNHKERAKKQEWISVKDRLPEVGQKVLVFDVDAEPDIENDIHTYSLECDEDGYYWSDEGGWWIDFENVSHWMPLPEPPEKNNEEEQG